MSVDHSAAVRGGDAKFLHVRPGHFVIVGGEETAKGDWWMGQVIFCEGGARDPKVNSLFQVADVDSGVIRLINACLLYTSPSPRDLSTSRMPSSA